MKKALQELVCEIEQLNDSHYADYFKKKLNHIERLEQELSFVGKLFPAEWRKYKQEHCPLIRGKDGLVHEIFYWQQHYVKQIKNVLKHLKENSKWQIQAEEHQVDRLQVSHQMA